MWKILKSDEPMNENDISELESQGWELRMCVPHSGSLYWYLYKVS